MKTALFLALVGLWTALTALTTLAMVTDQNLTPPIFFIKCLIEQVQKRKEKARQ